MKRRAANSGPGPSLFPFLAVLVCTMGSLIVLLVIVVQQARAQTDGSQAQDVLADERRQAEDETEQLREQERDVLLWKMDVLRQARQENLAGLEDARLQLAHLEENIRELEQRWLALSAQAAQVQSLQEQKFVDQQQSDSQLQQLMLAIEEAKRQLDEAKDEANKPQSFAIIPYHGTQGTMRRPIYLECTNKGVVLQPEGIVLGAADFAGLLGPGNPLDALVRAVRSHWIANGVVQSDREPYPLLLVRPSGVLSYGLSRAALEHWDDTFGYELVSEDLPLAYPDRDPQLAAAVEIAIRDARQRQLALVRAMPRAFGGEAREMMERSLGGGPGGDSALGDPYKSGRPGGEPGGDPQGQQSDRLDPNKDGEFAQTDPSPYPMGFDPLSDAGSPHGDNGSAVDGSRPAGGSSGGQGESALSQGGSPLGSSMPQPVALARGANWATEGTGRTATATGWTRPIQVQLRPEAILLAPEAAADGPAEEISLEQGHIMAVDALARSVKRRFQSWGQPPTGGYWKPVLQVRVAPGAENRYRELESLLRHSGLHLERK